MSRCYNALYLRAIFVGSFSSCFSYQVSTNKIVGHTLRKTWRNFQSPAFWNNRLTYRNQRKGKSKTKLRVLLFQHTLPFNNHRPFILYSLLSSSSATSEHTLHSIVERNTLQRRSDTHSTHSPLYVCSSHHFDDEPPS